MKCSITTFNPIIIRIIPPTTSALDLYLTPKAFPIKTPPRDISNVVIPIRITDDQIDVSTLLQIVQKMKISKK